MTVGIQAWDAAGNLVLDITDSVGKILGTMSIGESYTGTTVSGTIVVPKFSSLTGHTPFYAVISGDSWNVQISPSFIITGTNLIWTFPHATVRPDTTFIWGAA